MLWLPQSLPVLTVLVLAAITGILFLQWLRRREPPHLDALLLFGALALGLGVRQAAEFPEAASSTRELRYAGTAILVAYPLPLLRVVGQFQRVGPLMWAAAVLGLLSTWALLTARYVDPLAVQPRLGEALVLGYMILLSLYAAWGFVAGAMAHDGLPQRRLGLAAGAAAALTIAIVVFAAVRLEDGRPLLQGLPWTLGLGAAVLSYGAFAPPRWLVHAWGAQEAQPYLVGLEAQAQNGGRPEAMRRLCHSADRLLGGTSVALLRQRDVHLVAPDAGPDLLARLEADKDALEEAARSMTQPLYLRRGAHATADQERILRLIDTDIVVLVPIRGAAGRRGTLLVGLDHYPLFLPDILWLLQVLAEQTSTILSFWEAAEERAGLVAERHRAEREALQREREALGQASRLKSEFLANMSHELRTPLNSIIGFTELVREGRIGNVDAAARDALEDIVGSARHLNRIIHDILDLAKIESGRMDFDPRPTDIQEACEEVLAILRAAAAGKGHHVGLHVRLRTAVLDRTRLKQVLFNYLSNAIKFTPPGGTIRLRVLPEAGDRLRIEVEDNGIGVAPGEGARLFHEFEQLDAGRTKRHEGTGLGLALVKRLVEAQGGEVGFQSTPGRGSLFWATLPRHPAPAARRRTNPGARILVVEDDADDKRTITEALEAEGYNVDAVGTAEDARRHVGNAPYDAVILDLILPDGLGTDVLMAMRSRSPAPDAPVLIVSLVPQKEIGPTLPVQAYLEKPVRPAAIKDALRQARITPRRRRTMLVVTADKADTDALAESLARRGHPVQHVANGTQAQEACRKDPPAAVLIDLLAGDAPAFLAWQQETPGYSCIPVFAWNGHLVSWHRDRLGDAWHTLVVEAGVDRLLEELDGGRITALPET